MFRREFKIIKGNRVLSKKTTLLTVFSRKKRYGRRGKRRIRINLRNIFAHPYNPTVTVGKKADMYFWGTKIKTPPFERAG